MLEKVRSYAPELVEKSGETALAFSLKEFTREAVRRQNAPLARDLIHQAIRKYPRILIEDTRSTCTVLAATYLLSLLPYSYYSKFEKVARSVYGNFQKRQISKESFG